MVDVVTPLGATAALTAATTPVAGKVNRYNASAGALAVTLPALSTLANGAVFGLQKDELDNSANTVTFTRAGSDTLDSGGTTVTLRLAGSQRTLQVVTVGGTKYWKIINGHDPLTSLDTRFAPIGAAGGGSFVTAESSGAEAAKAALATGQVLFVLGTSVPYYQTLNPVAYFDAETLTSLADGAQIASWPAAVGGQTLTKTTANGPTISKTGFGGRAAAVFTNAQYLDTVLATITGPVSIVVIGSMDATVNSENFVDGTTAPNRAAISKVYNAGNSYFAADRNAVGSTMTPTDPSKFNTSPHILVYNSGAANGTSDLWIDGAKTGTTTAPATQADITSLRVGARADAGSMLDGKIAQVGVFNRLLTPTEIANLKGYAARWGI